MKNSKNSGFIKTMIVIIIALIFIKYYFHMDPTTIFNSPQFQQFLSAGKALIVASYNILDSAIKYLIQK